MGATGAQATDRLAAILFATEQHLRTEGEACYQLAELCRQGALHQPAAAEGTHPLLLGPVEAACRVATRLRELASELTVAADALDAVRGAPPTADQAHASQVPRLAAFEAERARIARELHDGPAQHFANAVLEVEYLQKLLQRDPAAVGEGLTRLRQVLQEGVREIRQCLFDLRLPTAGGADVVEALRTFLAEYERQYGLLVEASLPEGALPLGPEQRVAVLRILQEALTNARKHANAQRVRVRLEEQADTLVLEVVDDGRGFVVAQARQGRYGLLGMRERARLVGGRLEVHGRPGKGARIVLRLPLRPRR